MKRCDANSLRLYLVTDHTLSSGRSTEYIVSQAIEGGVSTIQLRDKGRSLRELLETGRKIKKLVSGKSLLFLVNDRVDLALALDCHGVHLGQNDLPLSEARKLLGEEKIIGISVDTLEQGKAAADGGADYIAINGVFPTVTKTDLGPPLGLEFIARMRSYASCPLVGIGGITEENAGEVIRTGCDGIAVVTAITKSENILESCQRLLQSIELGFAHRT